MTFDRGLRAMPFADRDERSERPACSLSRIRTTQQAMRENSAPSPNLCSLRAADAHLLHTLCMATRDTCRRCPSFMHDHSSHLCIVQAQLRLFPAITLLLPLGGAENWGLHLRRREPKRSRRAQRLA